MKKSVGCRPIFLLKLLHMGLRIFVSNQVAIYVANKSAGWHNQEALPGFIVQIVDDQFQLLTAVKARINVDWVGVMGYSENG